MCFDEHTLGDLGIRVGLGPDRMFSVLAACPGDPLTTMGQIEAAVDELVRAARALTGPLVDALTAGTPSQAPAVGGLAGWRDA